MDILDIINEEIIKVSTYNVDDSEQALEDEMYDAQGEKQQFLRAEDSPEDLFGNYHTPENIPIKSFITDSDVEGYRMMLDKQGKYGLETLEELKNAILQGRGLPPVTIWRESNNKYRLISGRHRILAALELGLTHIPVLKMYWRDKWEN